MSITNHSDAQFCSGAVPSAEIAGADTGATAKAVRALTLHGNEIINLQN
jgi:hypothetical protein